MKIREGWDGLDFFCSYYLGVILSWSYFYVHLESEFDSQVIYQNTMHGNPSFISRLRTNKIPMCNVLQDLGEPAGHLTQFQCPVST